MERDESQPTVSELHTAAMAMCDKAEDSRLHGLNRAYLINLRIGLDLEEHAASLVPVDAEPTRSVLYRSAGHLAFQIEDYSRAMTLVETGLAGNPPERIKMELEELRDKINALQA